jgi:hypothetical protein
VRQREQQERIIALQETFAGGGAGGVPSAKRDFPLS